ncbi:AMP-dependent synthetase and ligase [Paenibacillus curdlanolyticus YK9]|uniref:AMP-dependent synthetase and ligase n=1 Tax=Paenibacillus curdlanolyticus YK9 TaxID=717606 RepID=E0I5E1_9BACL|nr:long-chain fatty acid--CoA ligase [Paenibacillus curdlanolyticus]EFM12183.1 AMP-dependent synthetase and ligase [Paenibacillus curdlanolyticus YK9]
MHEHNNPFDLMERFRQYESRTAFVWQDVPFSYEWLLDRINQMKRQLAEQGIERAVVSLEEDYSPYAVAAMFALLEQRCIVLPLDRKLVEAKKEEYLSIAEAQARIKDTADRLEVQLLERGSAQHPLLHDMLEEGDAGLVIFSSGSSGKSKAAVHRADRLLRKYAKQSRALRTIPFMMFDHIGGLNTLLQTLSSGGCLYMLQDRAPAEVCRTIERYRVQALPVSPTFLNLLLLSGAHQEFDLSSMEVVSYGSEVMPTSTLAAWNEQFPDVRMVQAYGMSELGILPTKSKGSDSLLFSLRGDEVRYRIVDGMLEVKTESAMAGYLNAPNPFTEDGWLRTGDEAVIEDDCIRILGRRSEIINIGGEKVYPAEVEDVLHRMDEIEEVVVSAEPSSITGQMVKATVKLRDKELALSELRRRIWAFCQNELPSYKIPQKIVITEESLMGNRMKKIRTPQSQT